MEKARGRSMVGYSPEDAARDRQWSDFLSRLGNQEDNRLPLRDWLPQHYKEVQIELAHD
jgi:hypothetical protein